MLNKSGKKFIISALQLQVQLGTNDPVTNTDGTKG